MWKCHFKNLTTGKTFTKIFDSPYMMKQMLNKVKYSKKIQWLGTTTI